MDTMPALNTLLFIDLADAILIIGNSTDRTRLFAGALQMGDGTVWTCCRTLPALLAFHRIDIRPASVYADCAELTGIVARLSHTGTAVIRYQIGRDRAFLACRFQHVYHLFGSLRLGRWRLAQRQTDPLPDQLALLIDTAAISRPGSGDQLVGDPLIVFLIKITVPGQPGHFFNDFMFQFQDIFIIRNHSYLPQILYNVFLAASTTCASSTEVVTLPTPPGTGVMASTIGSASV